MFGFPVAILRSARWCGRETNPMQDVMLCATCWLMRDTDTMCDRVIVEAQKHECSNNPFSTSCLPMFLHFDFSRNAREKELVKRRRTNHQRRKEWRTRNPRKQILPRNDMKAKSGQLTQKRWKDYLSSSATLIFQWRERLALQGPAQKIKRANSEVFSASRGSFPGVRWRERRDSLFSRRQTPAKEPLLARKVKWNGMIWNPIIFRSLIWLGIHANMHWFRSISRRSS